MKFNNNVKKLLFERPNSDSNTSAKTISIYKNKILLLKNKDNTYELPGGHIKKGEIPINGAKREFFEETGIKIDRLKLFKKSKNRLIYVAFLLNNNIKLSKEHIGFIFIPQNKLNKIRLSNKAIKDLNVFINNIKDKKDEELQDIL